MPDFCNCGAQLADDSLFCHKCGKPQRDLVEVEAPAPEPAAAVIPQSAPVAQPRIPTPLGFRNPIALRVAILSATGALLLSSFLPFINWIAAGFFAVFLYRRKTRAHLDVGAGLQIGWITGLITFVAEGGFFLVATASGLFSPAKLAQAKNWPMVNDPNFPAMLQFFTTPPGLALCLICMFIFIVALTMAGGALGAKLVGRG